MVQINKAIHKLLDKYKPQEIADVLGVSTAMISTWKNKDNDFCPRLGVASKIYKAYNVIVYPYDESALESYDTL